MAHNDPAGAYDLLYAAAHKSLAAALTAQGLRATSAGGHIAVQDTLTNQLGRSGSVIKPFGRMRRNRNDADYPRIDTPTVTTDDILDDLTKAELILTAMRALLPHLGPW